MKISLYELNAEYQKLLDVILDEDIAEEEKEAYLTTLEDVKYSIEEKAQNIVWVRDELKNRVDRIKTLKSNWDARMKYYDNKIKRLEENLKQALELTQTGKIETDYNTISLVNNGGVLPLIVDEENVPQEYMKIIYEVDKDRIKKELNEGQELEFARYGEKGKHLNIK